MRVPLIQITNHLVLGSGINAMVQSVELAKLGKVLMITEDTCLYSEIVRTGDFRIPHLYDSYFKEMFFPSEVFDSEIMLHPDRLKLHGEVVFDSLDISLLYACDVVGWIDGKALVAHKSGLYAVQYDHIYDMRAASVCVKNPAYCLNVLEGDGQRSILFPTVYTQNTPENQLQRFLSMTETLDEEVEIGRGGTVVTEMTGLEFAIVAGKTILPSDDNYPSGKHKPIYYNPLHASLEQVSLPAVAAKESLYDVIVVGGGTAGAPAAIQSARMGLKTLLIEMNRQLGGTGTIGGVNSYWFGLRSNATQKIDQAVERNYRRLRLHRKPGVWDEFDGYLGDLKANALLEMCLEAGVEVSFSSIAFGVLQEGNQVQGVYYSKNGQVCCARAGIVIDCTGDGDICMFAGAAHTYGNQRNGMTFWASLAQYTSPNTYRNNFSTMVHLGDPLDYTRFIKTSRKFGDNMFDHGQYVAVRESRHIKGLEIVTLEKILSFEKVHDTLYTCFSNYDPKGHTSSDIVYFGLLQPNQKIPIPLKAVIPVDKTNQPIEGLLIGGKAISCTHDAMPAIRMQPDMQTQGFSLAVLAAHALWLDCPAWEVTEIQNKILKAGGDNESIPERNPQTPVDSIAAIKENEPWEWLEMSPITWAEQVSPIIRLMFLESVEAVPILRDAYNKETNDGTRLSLARLLLWHRDETGVQDVINEIKQQLQETPDLPKRKASIQYGQLLPDHGLMPETVYLLNSLGHTRKTKIHSLFLDVLERLEKSQRDWLDLRSGIFCYCESFAYVAVKRSDREMVPMIHRILSLPEFSQEQYNDLMQERFQMLQIILLDALYQLGDIEGKKQLESWCNHPKRIFAQAANMILNAARD
jgi:hypothetical protein